MKFNINHTVRVKITKRGRYLLTLNHERRFMGLKPQPPLLLDEDAEGWSTWQLWTLMQEFGPHLYNGCEVPFETEIEIIVPAE